MADVELKLEALNDAKLVAIRKYWGEGKKGEFKSRHAPRNASVTIKYMTFEHPNQKAAVVISSGRTECMFKYDETIYDLHQQGYSVYIHDHRGQGFSGTTTGEPKDSEDGHGPGHVEKFDHYVDDLHQFVTEVVLPSQSDLEKIGDKLMLLGHSMGGCIATLYIEQHTDVFAAAVLCAPMHEPDVGLLPNIAVESAAALRRLKGQAEEYAGRGKAYTHKEFDDGDKETWTLTHSRKRYERILAMFDEHKDARVGGASYGWVHEALNAGDRAIERAGDIEIDVLLLQAGEDAAVTAAGQNKFEKTLNAIHPNRCELVPIDDAYHELMIEISEEEISEGADTGKGKRDQGVAPYRDTAMELMLAFFKKHA